MNTRELELIEKWEVDKSFINWAKNANEKDVSKWEAYFSENPDHREWAENVRFSILHMKVKSEAVDPQKSRIALERLKSNVKSSKSRKNTTKVISFSKMWKVAAAVALLVGISFWTVSNNGNSDDQQLWMTQDTKNEFLLEDGSKVILNKNSTLTYDKASPRQVTLNGEAFFIVAKDPIHKSEFTVTTDDLVVEVLGTEFNVNTNDNKTKVFLDEGKVKLTLEESNMENLEMHPGDFVSYSKKQKQLENNRSIALKHIGWKEDILFFEESSLSEVIGTVQNLYNISFETNQVSSLKETFTGGIPMQNLDITLETIKNIYQLEIIKTKEQYILRRKNL